jgi:hypothetical protein
VNKLKLVKRSAFGRGFLPVITDKDFIGLIEAS